MNDHNKRKNGYAILPDNNADVSAIALQQLLNAAAKDIAVFRLSCLPNEEAARLAHNALRGHTAD